MLINCVVYDKGHRLHDIQPDQIGDTLGQPDRFVWVALHDPSAQEMARYQEAFGLHELAVEDTLKGDQRPKLEEYDSALFMIMHMVAMTDGELQSGQVAVFAGPGYVLSARPGPGVRRGAQTLRKRPHTA